MGGTGLVPRRTADPLMARTGRPRLVEDALATEQVRVRCTPALRLELRRIAQARGTTMSDLVRETINVFVDDYGGRQVFPSRRR